MALIYESLNNIEEAVKYYQKTIDLNEKHYEAHIRMGKLLFRIDIIDDAMMFFVEALEINPK